MLLNNSYWASNYCRKELARVLERFEQDRSVRLLFVKAEELDPAHYTFDKDRATGRVQSENSLVNHR